MAQYILPRVQIQQEFTTAPIFATQPLAAVIVGPHYKLVRYGEASERYPSTLGTYPAANPADPVVKGLGDHIPVGGLMDADFTRIFFDNVMAQYFPNAELGSTTSDDDATLVSGTVNKMLASKVIFKGDYRTACFGDRDVAAGDYVQVTGAVGGEVMTTKIQRVMAEAHVASFVPQTVATGATTTTTVTSHAANWPFVAGGSAVGHTAANQRPTAASVLSSVDNFGGTEDITYIVTVTNSGTYGVAKVIVTSDRMDSSPETVVQKSGSNNYSVALNLGNLAVPGTTGVTFRFDGATLDLHEGDYWTVKIYAPITGAYNILEVEDNLRDNLTEPFTFQLFVKKSGVEIPRLREAISQNPNWVVKPLDMESTITLEPGITVNETGLAVAGTLIDLPISSADAFATYRFLLTDTARTIGSISDSSKVATILGPITPDNPLAQGVYLASLNAANVAVYYTGLVTDDLEGYAAAFELLKNSDAVYGVVPLTFNKDVQVMGQSHVDLMSTPEAAKWRVLWVSRQVAPELYVQDVDVNGDALVGTVALDDDSNARDISIAGGRFAELGVRPGDYLETNYVTDAKSGAISFTRYLIEGATSNTTLHLLQDFIPTGMAQQGVQDVPIQMKIVRVLTGDEKVANYIADITTDATYKLDDRRVRIVFPDTVKSGSTVLDGYYVAAALAGLRSGVVPHQGLTNIEVLGFTDTEKSVTGFTYSQLNAMAGAGVWIVTQKAVGQVVYTRHQLTSSSSLQDVKFVEDSVTTNVDSICYGLQTALAPFIGKYNINPTNLVLVRDAINRELKYRATQTFVDRAGNQLLGYTIRKLAQNAIYKDRIDVEVELTVPYPMNVITVTLIV